MIRSTNILYNKGKINSSNRELLLAALGLEDEDSKKKTKWEKGCDHQVHNPTDCDQSAGTISGHVIPV